MLKVELTKFSGEKQDLSPSFHITPNNQAMENEQMKT
jgi:hypothetical protein